MGISEMTQSSAVKGIFYININFMTDLLVKIRTRRQYLLQSITTPSLKRCTWYDTKLHLVGKLQEKVIY